MAKQSKSTPKPRKATAPRSAKVAASRLANRLDDVNRKLRLAPVATPAPSARSISDEEVQRRFEDLQQVATSLVAAVDLQDILDRIVDGILRVARCERGYVLLQESDGMFATYTGRHRDEGEWSEEDARRISSTIVGNVLESRRPYIESDLLNMENLKESDSIQAGMILCAVCLPLLHGDRLIGLIYADSRQIGPSYTDSDRGVLQVFALQAAYAVENAKRQGELKRRSDQLEGQNLSLTRQLAREFALAGMISRSKAMFEVFELVQRVAPDDLSVLILGESGTGKEVLAQAIHHKSLRAERPFQAVNCSSIPRDLVESTLFGHTRGAFSGAIADQAGVFEVANGGTVFLDEIGDMPPELQPKLLRVLQEKKFERVGEVGRLRSTDVRIISATNLDIVAAVNSGKFREDLFFRLKGAMFAIPALRDRQEDILPLAEHFLDQFAEEKGQPRAQLTSEARTVLLSHSWPGNVRELQTIVRGAALLHDKHVIHAPAIERMLVGSTRLSAGPKDYEGTLREQIDRLEEKVIRRALSEHDGNVTSMSKALGLSRQQLYNKFHKFDIEFRSD